MTPSEKHLLARAEKAEAALYEACQQLAGEYTLGEPLTEDEWDKLDDDSPIIYKTVFGHVRQSMKSHVLFVEGVRYADPRPWPVLPEPKEDDPKLFTEWGGAHHLTDEGRRRLERLLNESEAKDE